MPGTVKTPANFADPPSATEHEFTLLATEEFLQHLARLGIDCQASEGKLRLNAPAGMLTERLQAELRLRKPELLIHLSEKALSIKKNVAPLSFAQQRLWIFENLSPGTATYNIPQSWSVLAPIDRPLLTSAIGQLIERHPSLRIRIEGHQGQPSQVATDGSNIPIKFVEMDANQSPLPIDLQIQALLAAQGAVPFDLTAGPLIRFRVFQISSEHYIFSFDVHHIVADQRSLNLIKRDLAEIYNALLSGKNPNLPALTVDYLELSRRESQPKGRSQADQRMAHWRERLAGMPTLLELPFSKPRPAEQSEYGARHLQVMSAELTGNLRRLASAANTSLYLLTLTIFAAQLYRYTNQSDLCIGTPVSTRKNRDEEDVVGLFVNMLPLRCRMEASETLGSLSRRISNEALTDFEHRDTPFQHLVSELHPKRSNAFSPFFQITFALNPRGPEADQIDQEIDLGIAKYDLTLQISEREDTLACFWEYRIDLFTPEDIHQFSLHYLQLADSFSSTPDITIGSAELLTPQDQRSFEQWNATALDFDRSETLASLFEQQASRHPSAVVLLHQGQSVTFHDLNQQAEQLANHLSREGIQHNDFVAICLDRTPDLVIAILAVLKLGAAYLPLDPKYPEERLIYMLQDSQAKALISERGPKAATLLVGNSGCQSIVWSERIQHSSRVPAMPRPPEAIQPEDVAYLIYTSGSTGKPKGTIVEHRNAVALLAWARSFFSPESLRHVLASTSVCFDLSIFEIFLPLVTGNTLVLVDDLLALRSSPHADQVTLVNTVPSAMTAFLESGLPASVKTVCMAGEFLPTSLVDRVYQEGVEQVFDLYGPTETTTYSTVALRLPNAAPTIGRPIANTRIYLLDEDMLQVPPTATGEIYIGGEGVTRGYLHRPELTEQRFLSLGHIDPASRLYRTGDLARQQSDGTLVYCGRRDNQIKLRGHRIELGEIEAVLREIAMSNDVAVIVSKIPSGDQLSAFIGLSASSQSDQQRSIVWIESLRKRLPGYMIPASLTILSELPKTLNGKIDRNALAALTYPASSEPGQAPATLLEQYLANIFASRLRTHSISRHAHFFDDLGGHSLVAFEIFVEIEKRLGVSLMLTTLFHAPTIESLSATIERHHWCTPKRIEFKHSGSSETVFYLIGPTPAPSSQSGERIMVLNSSGLEDPAASAKEIMTFEASRPSLILICPSALETWTETLQLNLRHAGLPNVAIQVLH